MPVWEIVLIVYVVGFFVILIIEFLNAGLTPYDEVGSMVKHDGKERNPLVEAIIWPITIVTYVVKALRPVPAKEDKSSAAQNKQQVPH